MKIYHRKTESESELNLPPYVVFLIAITLIVAITIAIVKYGSAILSWL